MPYKKETKPKGIDFDEFLYLSDIKKKGFEFFTVHGIASWWHDECILECLPLIY